MLVLKPVVEAPRESLPFWCPLPAMPWPSYVELVENSTEEEVGLVLLQLATYNRREQGPLLSATDLARAESLVLPGGLAVSKEGRTVVPSCCCGLEDWPEWHMAVSDGSSPWMGHDPSPWLQVQGDNFYLWPDEALPQEERDLHAIAFTKAELQEQLSVVSRELAGFAARLREVLERHSPSHAHEVAAAFARTFVQPIE
jgi:hypothetical protein